MYLVVRVVRSVTFETLLAFSLNTTDESESFDLTFLNQDLMHKSSRRHLCIERQVLLYVQHVSFTSLI